MDAPERALDEAVIRLYVREEFGKQVRRMAIVPHPRERRCYAFRVYALNGSTYDFVFEAGRFSEHEGFPCWPPPE